MASDRHGFSLGSCVDQRLRAILRGGSFAKDRRRGGRGHARPYRRSVIATEGHQPCRLLRHSAGAPYGVSMLSSLHPGALRSALAAVAAVTCLGVLAAPSADARTSRNVCEDYADQPSGASDTLACGTQVSIPGHRSRNLDAGVECRYRVAGTQRAVDRLFLRPAWDYWTQRGQWVTARRSGLVFDEGGDLIVFVAARAHNWYLHPWPARAFARCDATPKATASSTPGQTLVGSPADDTLKGSPGRDIEQGAGGDDRISGGGGQDALAGGEGADELNGGSGDDEEVGGRGSDELHGGAGNDVLMGGPGDDQEWGGPGGDELFDDGGNDALHGGPGNDRFSAKDGNVDLIDCGEGVDQVVADADDRTVGCEQVWTSEAQAPLVPPEI
jgi:hypothetical protein